MEPLGKLFSLMTKKYIAMVTEQLRDMDIERHFYVVFVVANTTKPFTQKDLAAYLDIDKTSMVRVVDYLSSHGYLERVANPGDRREYFIHLTEKGKAASKEIEAAFERANENCWEGFSSSSQKVITQGLDQMKANLCNIPSTDLQLKFEKRKRK